RIVTHGGRSCIAVIIPGSEDRPHFSGRSYIRQGTQTLDASPEQFVELLTQRNNKARRLLEAKGQKVTLETIKLKGTPHFHKFSTHWQLVDCNQFYVMLKLDSKDEAFRSIPLAFLELAEDEKQRWLKLVIEE